MARGERALLVAEDERGAIIGTAQVGLGAAREPAASRRRRQDAGASARAPAGRGRGGARGRRSALPRTPARRCWCSTPRARRPKDSMNDAAGSASAPFPISRCGPTAGPAPRWSTTKGWIDAARAAATSSRTFTAERAMKRREFISALGGASAFAFLPAFTRAAFADAATLDELTISDVEILKLSGTHRARARPEPAVPGESAAPVRGAPAEAVQGSARKHQARAQAADALLPAHPHQGRRRRASTAWSTRKRCPSC